MGQRPTPGQVIAIDSSSSLSRQDSVWHDQRALDRGKDLILTPGSLQPGQDDPGHASGYGGTGSRVPHTHPRERQSSPWMSADAKGVELSGMIFDAGAGDLAGSAQMGLESRGAGIVTTIGANGTTRR